jgi:outer membrane protein
MALSILMIAASGAYAAGVEIAVGGWQQSISGTLGYEALSDDDIVDLEDDLDFDDENALFGRLKIDMPAFFPNLYVVAAPISFEGNGAKNETFNFGGTEFQIDADLEAEINLNQVDVALYYGLPFIRTASAGKFNIDIGLNVRFVDLDTRVSGTVAGAGGGTAEEEQSLQLPIPMAYVAFQIMPTDWLAIEVEGRGLAIGDNSLYSVTGRVRYNFAGPVFAAVGYRSDMIDVDEDDIIIDADFAGPFLELGLKF